MSLNPISVTSIHVHMYSTRQKKLAIPSLRKTVYMVRCYKRTVEQRSANAQRRCAQRQAVPFKRSRAKIDNARVLKTTPTSTADLAADQRATTSESLQVTSRA